MDATDPPAPRKPSLEEALRVLECLECHERDFAVDGSVLACRGCGNKYPLVAGIVDALVSPSRGVIEELRGTMRENDVKGDDWHGYRLRHVERVTPFAERKASTANDTFDYYGSIELNLLQALAHVKLTGKERVLEIGGHDDYRFLLPFRERGCTCFESNIYFVYSDEQTADDWPIRVLADMHYLPFAAESFDVVLISAATHHATDMPRAMRELARVTKKGGVVINVNEPIRGVMKHLFAKNHVETGKQDTTRDELVHEHEYSIFEYMRAFRAAGLALEKSFFADYYARRLSGARTSGVRFAGLASVVSKAWQLPIVRKFAEGPGLWLGQATLGLQMDVILRKR